MKNSLLVLFAITSMHVAAQNNNYHLKKGYVAEGYDVTAYFKNKAVEGKKEFTTTYDGVNFKFATAENLATFKANPLKFIPQYGGYCAYAIANSGKKVGIDPETFEIRDGKLYLFYNSWGTNTLNKWKKENPEKLINKADLTWETVRNKK